jgi:hypothetical protein
MTEAARERCKRTSNVLRQRLKAVASYAATVKPPEEEGPGGVARWEKTCGEYVTRGKPSGKSAQASGADGYRAEPRQTKVAAVLGVGGAGDVGPTDRRV